MNTVIVASTRPYTGKSGIVLALLDTVVARGDSVAYFKPYGTMPAMVDGVHTDLDAAYIARHLDSPHPLDMICPVIETDAFMEDVVAGRTRSMLPDVLESFAHVSEGAGTVFVEGPSDLFQGRSVNVSAHEVAEALDACVLLVTPGDRTHLPDDVLCAADLMGERLAGVLFNAVHPSVHDFVVTRATPFLESRGVPVFGVIARDPALSAVSIREIADELGGTVLCAEEHLESMAESFMVGAMGQDKALRFFRRRPRKVVVTGGDRADVQLAALETDTRAIILTGDLAPAAAVLSRAEELGVPMVLVSHDTLATVERLERLFGRMRIHDPVKAARIREMLTESVDIDQLLAAVGSPNRA